jgi:O-succinylbenzoate synthase
VKIFTLHYTLQPGPDPARAARGPRRGALLRVEFDDESIGFADLHPWTEFGQVPLEEQLASLRSNQPTLLANLALRHARTDAAARRAGLSLFDGLPEVRSHALFTNWTNAPRTAFELCVAESYSAIKLKIGRDPAREAVALNQLADLPLRWRLDANASPGTESFVAQLAPATRTKIEFLEDPMPYEPSAWTTLASREKIPLALDWQLPNSPAPWPGAEFLVIKPASQDAFTLALDAAKSGIKMIVTHSMDHPLGQAVALWTARRLRQRHGELICHGGLQAIGLYQSDAYSEQLQTRGPLSLNPPGTGFGFDDQLAKEHWTKLG